MTRLQVLTTLAWAATLAGMIHMLLQFLAVGLGELLGKI